uniref:Myelin-associated glycoprotein-like n=1 Tax=Saccoglossus kowalevskii TaxID=10224 RepID=A0ABM0MCY2_SACKO
SPSVTVTDMTDFNVVEGNSYCAECEVDSNPDSVVTWLYPDGTQTEGYELEIANTNRNDAGTYTCTAGTTFWDGSLAIDRGTMDLNVEYAGIVALVGSEEEVDESESVSFRCTVNGGNPDPFKMQITLDDEVVAQGDDVLGITHLEYTISESTVEDTGSYICIATQRFWNDAENDVTSNVHHLTVNVPASTGLIILVVILAVVVIIVIVIFIRRYRKKQRGLIIHDNEGALIARSRGTADGIDMSDIPTTNIENDNDISPYG